MQNYLVPKPIGNEIININNGEKFTYKEIMCLKNKIDLVITNAQQKIQNNMWCGNRGEVAFLFRQRLALSSSIPKGLTP